MSEKSLIEQIEEEANAKRERDRRAKEESEQRKRDEEARIRAEEAARAQAQAAAQRQPPQQYYQQPPPQYYQPQYPQPPPPYPQPAPPRPQVQPPPYYPPPDQPQQPPQSPVAQTTRPPDAQKTRPQAIPAKPPRIEKPRGSAPPSLSKHSQTFLKMNAHEGFDLDALNELDFSSISEEALSSPARAAKVLAKCEELLGRACQDLGDPTIIDDILRAKLIIWYKRSPDDQEWLATMPSRWSGVFHESRAAGGMMRTSLISRLERLRAECDSVAPKDAKPSKGLFSRVFSSGAEKEPEAPKPFCPPQNPLMLQAAQAFLDDLASGRKKDGQSFPLVRLSEIAQRGGAVSVNKAFAELFTCEERGPFVILLPARFPEFDLVAIRPPPPNAPKVSIVYDLVCVKAPPQTTAPDAAALVGSVAAPAAMGIMLGTTQVMTLSGGPTAAAPADFTAAIWDRTDITKDEWKATIEAARSQRGRLEAPPNDYRKRPSYFQLRELIVADRQASRPFLSVKWRGKPTGIIVLAQLLADKAVTPDAETDCEYLEAELGDIERGNTEYRPPNGQWVIGGNVRVVREAKQGMLAYRAEPAS